MTKDKRIGICTGSLWTENLMNDDSHIVGFFVVKVDFGYHFEYHTISDLSRDRFRKS